MSMANARPLFFLFGISLDFRSRYTFQTKLTHCCGRMLLRIAWLLSPIVKKDREIKEVKAMFKPPIPQSISCLVKQFASNFFQSWAYIFYSKLYCAQCSSNKVAISSSIEILQQLNFLVYIYIKSKKNMMNLKYWNRDFWITIF